jgi:hypothetical protein
MEKALEVVRQEPRSIEVDRFMPVMSIEVAIERRKVIVEAVAKLMKPGIDGDYGVIPGTKKPTLLQPGADKLNNLFGLVPTFQTVEKDLDWTGERHGGEAFFYYEVKCELYRGTFKMGEGHGSANSWEAKHRYRKAERVCPHCGTEAIIKGKSDWGGGWLCYAKKGGCGAKFKDGDEAIEAQMTGNVPNPNGADLVNGLLKTANKRAKVAATLNAVSAHEFFAQDIEDLMGDLQAGEEKETEARTKTAKEADTSRDTSAPEDDSFPAHCRRSIKTSKEAIDVLDGLRGEIYKLTGNQEIWDAVVKTKHKMGEGRAWTKLSIAEFHQIIEDVWNAKEAFRQQAEAVPAA